MRSGKNLALFSELLSVFSVQGGASIAKNLFLLVSPACAVTLRVGISGILLALIDRPKIFSFTKKQWLCILFYGFSIVAMNTTFYYGIQRVPLGIGVTIEFAGPLGLALITSRKKTDFLWAILAAAGILMVVPWKGSSGPVDPLGVVFVAVAGVMWALYIVAGERIAGQVKNMDAVACGMCVATLFSLPLGIAGGELFHLNGHILLLALGVAVFSSALSALLDLVAMKRLAEKTYSVIQSLNPAVAALSGLVFLHERLSLIQWLAILCIVAASSGAALCAPEKKSENGAR